MEKKHKLTGWIVMSGERVPWPWSGEVHFKKQWATLELTKALKGRYRDSLQNGKVVKFDMYFSF